MEFSFLKYTLWLVLLLQLFGCRKDVSLELPEYQEKIVIEASIETGLPAIAYISKGVPYFGEFDFTQPQEAFVKNAIVVVSDGSNSDTLVALNPAIGYVYSGTKLFGKTGGVYTIKVTVNNQTFEATTTILNPPQLDSLYFKAERDSLGFIWQKFSEPAGSGNAYRWFAKRLNRDVFYSPPFNSVFNDQFIDGKTFEFGYDRGAQPNQSQANRDDPERGYYKMGDTVIVKFCTIGKAEYDFWYTYYLNRSSNGNPFSAPVNVKSMFSDFTHSFGAFVGYSPRFDTLVIPKK